MAVEPTKTLADVARAVGRYPEEAYHFVREGLNHAVEHIHGPPTPEQLQLATYLADHEIDLAELVERMELGQLDPTLARAIEDAGGIEKLNRHVSGQQLCWGLRDLALEKWGLMASAVLRKWRIYSTEDFGRIVFALVEAGHLQKRPEDSFEDFKNVYDFHEAFENAYEIHVKNEAGRNSARREGK